MNEFEAPVPQSGLSLIISGMGAKYGLLLLAAASTSVAVTLLLMFRGRGAALGPALLLIVPLPLVVAAFAVVGGVMDSYGVIASSDVAPKPSEVAQGFSRAISTALGAICFMFPIGILAVVGGLVRAFIADKSSPQDSV